MQNINMPTLALKLGGRNLACSLKYSSGSTRHSCYSRFCRAHISPLVIYVNLCIKSMITLLSVDNATLWAQYRKSGKNKNSPLRTTSQTQPKLSNSSHDLIALLHRTDQIYTLPKVLKSSLQPEVPCLAMITLSDCPKFRKTRTVSSANRDSHHQRQRCFQVALVAY